MDGRDQSLWPGIWLWEFGLTVADEVTGHSISAAQFRIEGFDGVEFYSLWRQHVGCG